VLECNPAFARLLGYEDPAAAADHVLFPAELRDLGGESLLDALIEGETLDGREMEMADRHGRPVRVLVSARLVQRHDEAVREILWTSIPLP
jgi:PAS domain-containing protein